MDGQAARRNDSVAAGLLDAPADTGLRSSADLLRGALLESRQRWRDLVCMAADFAFETDAAGKIVFAAPERVLGWPADSLLGRDATGLLATPDDGFDPFAPGPSFRGRKAWLRGAEGRVACMQFAVAPLVEGDAMVGVRGVAQNVTGQDAQDARIAAALRRGEVVDHILRQMRQEVLAPRMMQAVLEDLLAALGGAGAAVLDLLAPVTEPVLHRTGAEPGALLPMLLASLQVDTPDPVITTVEGHPILACPSYTRFGERAGLCVWRSAGAAGWTEDDAQLTSSATAIVRVVLEHEAIQQELARQARTDPLTGLLNRRFFIEEVSRRLDRLEREGQPATLIFVDLDNFKTLNDSCGHEFGDVALVETAKLLRSTVRPTDLVARLGGDEFALWLDNSDELTAAERAEHLRLHAPALLAAHLPPEAPALSTSIGIAARYPATGEALDDVMRRADEAMYFVKRSGRANWRVSRDPMLP